MLRHCFSALALLAAATANADSAVPAANFQQQSQALTPLAAEPELREKRYVAALARNGDLPFTVRREWHKKLHPAVSAHRGLQAALAPAPNLLGIPGKRYVGSLARAGQMPGKRSLEEEMNDAIDDQMLQLLVDEIATTEAEEKQLKLQELQDLQELQELQDDPSLTSFGHGSNLSDRQDEDDVKRGISTLAKNGQLPAPLTPGDNRSDDTGDESTEHKRGGVASLARLGYLQPHKKDLDWLLSLLEEQKQFRAPDSKRNIASLARGFSLPPSGKRNLGALARGGGFSALRYANSKKNNILEPNEEKRGFAWASQQRVVPLGKRLLDAQPVPAEESCSGTHDRHMPQQLDALKRSKEEKEFSNGSPEHLRYDLLDSLHDIREFNKRYVAALLRHGRLPVGDGSLFGGRLGSSDDGSSDHDNSDSLNEEKRHIGALRRISKRSTSSTADERAFGRDKRQARPYPSDEILLPVFLTNEQNDYDDALSMTQATKDASEPDKRFLGRIPQMSRSRPRAQMQPSVRRDRPRSRNI